MSLFCGRVFRVCGAKLSWRFAGQMVLASSAHSTLDVYRQRKPRPNMLLPIPRRHTTLLNIHANSRMGRVYSTILRGKGISKAGHSNPGGGMNPWNSRSSRPAKWMHEWSPYWGPMIWTPTGKPLLANPAGATVDGR